MFQLSPEKIAEDRREEVVRLHGYRSFGTHRGEKIRTQVFIAGNKIPCVERVDIYEKADEQKEDVTPKKNDVVPIET